MREPMRIQRKRERGWKMPPNTVYVGRGTIWGNPFIVGEPCGIFPEGMGLRGAAETLVPALSLEQALKFYRDLVEGYVYPEMYPAGHQWRDDFSFRTKSWTARNAARSLLGGKNLCCWCPLDQRCHADILLEIANPSARASLSQEQEAS